MTAFWSLKRSLIRIQMKNCLQQKILIEINWKDFEYSNIK